MSNSGFYIRILNSLTLNRSEARITLNSTCNKSFCEPSATERRSKKLTDITDAHGVFNTDFFDLSFPMQRDSKRICKCDRLRLVLDHESPESHEYIPCRDLKDSSDSSDSCSKKTFAYDKLSTNLPNQTNHLICRQNQKKNPSEIPFVLSRYNPDQTKIKR